MQSVSSWIWTRVTVFISYDNNLYTTGKSDYRLTMCRSPQENTAYEFVLTSPAVHNMFGLFYLDGLWGGW